MALNILENLKEQKTNKQTNSGLRFIYIWLLNQSEVSFLGHSNYVSFSSFR